MKEKLNGKRIVLDLADHITMTIEQGEETVNALEDMIEQEYVKRNKIHKYHPKHIQSNH